MKVIQVLCLGQTWHKYKYIKHQILEKLENASRIAWKGLKFDLGEKVPCVLVLIKHNFHVYLVSLWHSAFKNAFCLSYTLIPWQEFGLLKRWHI